MVISVDFDGKICKNGYPDLGDILPGAKETINYLFNRGHIIVINTCRANSQAENAKAYLINNGIKFSYFNENYPKLIEKYNSDTRKISADCYLDDRHLDEVVRRQMLGIESYHENIWQEHLEQFQYAEKPTIICITGCSGAGKSLAASYLNSVYNISIVNSYTNREQRNDKDTDHVFLTEKEYNNIEGTKLAETTFGEEGKIQYHYCSLIEDMDHINSYLITEDGLEELKFKWDSLYDIYAIRIKRPLFDRISSVGEARCNRDLGKFEMKDNQFDHIINNDTNDKQYLYNEIDAFMTSSRLDRRAELYDIHIID